MQGLVAVKLCYGTWEVEAIKNALLMLGLSQGEKSLHLQLIIK